MGDCKGEEMKRKRKEPHLEKKERKRIGTHMKEREKEESKHGKGIKKQYFLITFSSSELLEMATHYS